jgi:hypothetical protein
MTLNRWVHIAMVVNGTNVNFYRDGLLTSSNTVTSVDAYTPFRDLILGWEENAPTHLNGALSDIAFWSRALTPAEVMSVESSPALVSSGRVGWWPLDEGSGTSVTSPDSGVSVGTASGTTWTQRCDDGTTG